MVSGFGLDYGLYWIVLVWLSGFVASRTGWVVCYFWLIDDFRVVECLVAWGLVACFFDDSCGVLLFWNLVYGGCYLVGVLGFI